MRPRERRESGKQDLFRSRLDQILDMNHALAKLARAIDWRYLEVSLRQSYRRVGKLALIKHQRYAHAHQFKRAHRSLRKLRTYLGRVIRDLERRIVGKEDLREAFVRPLYLARRVLEQSAASAVARSIPCTRQRSSA
jgi:hypothetical protein